ALEADEATEQRRQRDACDDLPLGHGANGHRSSPASRPMKKPLVRTGTKGKLRGITLVRLACGETLSVLRYIGSSRRRLACCVSGAAPRRVLRISPACTCRRL